MLKLPSSARVQHRTTTSAILVRILLQHTLEEGFPEPVLSDEYFCWSDFLIHKNGKF